MQITKDHSVLEEESQPASGSPVVQGASPVVQGAAAAPHASTDGLTGDGLTGELRMGLAMCGGIALTLYEAGVSHELYRFYKAWDAYVQQREGGPVDALPDYEHLHEHIPNERDTIYASHPQGYLEAFSRVPLRPVVDILTGASAGGINSVFLASCIATGQDFGRFHDVWINVADIGELQYKTTEPVRGLLNPSALEEQMRAKLEENLAAYEKLAQNDKEKLKEIDLFVRLCRTHQHGHLQTTIDSIGHIIDVQQKADIISFRTEHFRGKSSSEADDAQIDQLSKAALATSAFPGIFPPVYDETEGRWYVDGGLWDNQPIDLAVEAVQDKPAFSRTHRCLLFVEPNPTADSESSLTSGGSSGSPRKNPACPEAEPSQGAVLQSLLFMGLKGNIGPAIDSILRFNQRNSLYNSVVAEPMMVPFAQQFGWNQFIHSAQQCQFAIEWVNQFSAKKSSPPITSHFFPLTALNQKRIQSLLFDDDPALIQEWDALIQRLGYTPQRPQGVEDEGKFAMLISLAALAIVGGDDIKQRLLRARLMRVNDELNNGKKVEKGQTQQNIVARKQVMTVARRQNIAARKAVIYDYLDRLNKILTNDHPYNYTSPDERAAHCNDEFRHKVCHSHSRFRLPTENMLVAIREKLSPYRGSPVPPHERQQVISDLWNWLEEVRQATQTVSLSAEEPKSLQLYRASPGYQQDAQRGEKRLLHAERWLDKELCAVMGVLDVAEETAAGHTSGDWLLPQAPRSYSMADYVWVDLTLYVLASVSDLVEKRSIDLVRVSGNDTNNKHLISDDLKGKGTAAQQKLAGEGLGHVLGFLENRWRRNDYVWGRLDACEILVRTLRYYGALEGLPVNEDERVHAREQALDILTELVEGRKLLDLAPGESLPVNMGATDYESWIASVPPDIRAKAEESAEFRQWCFRAFGGRGMTDAEYEKCVVDAQTAILRQEARLFQIWRKKQDGKKPKRFEVSECAGLPPKCGQESDERQRKMTQNANARIIGFGQQDIMDANEPKLSKNLNYLVQATIRLSRGSSDKAPSQLEVLGRVSRLVSYAVGIFAWIVPVEVHQRRARTFWGWLGATLVIVGFFCGATYLMTQPHTPASSTPATPSTLSIWSASLVLLRGLLVTCGLVCLGGVVGSRWTLAAAGLFCVGMGSGFLMATHSWPLSTSEPTFGSLFWIAIGLGVIAVSVLTATQKSIVSFFKKKKNA